MPMLLLAPRLDLWSPLRALKYAFDEAGDDLSDSDEDRSENGHDGKVTWPW